MHHCDVICMVCPRAKLIQEPEPWTWYFVIATTTQNNHDSHHAEMGALLSFAACLKKHLPPWITSTAATKCYQLLQIKAIINAQVYDKSESSGQVNDSDCKQLFVLNFNHTLQATSHQLTSITIPRWQTSAVSTTLLPLNSSQQITEHLAPSLGAQP